MIWPTNLTWFTLYQWPDCESEGVTLTKDVNSVDGTYECVNNPAALTQVSKYQPE